LSYDGSVTFGEGQTGSRVGEFGNKFRKAREKKNLSLDDVSNVTKIGSRMLQAIEEEHFDQLPGGVFNKGFIRAYAKHLGLNDEDAVTDYLACLRQAQIDAHEVWEPQPGAQTRTPERPRPVQPNRPAPTPIRAAEKAQTPAQIEELPELQLPRAEDVRPRRREFIQQPDSTIPWRMLGVAAVVIVVAVMLWTRRSHRTNAAAATAAPVQTAQAAPMASPAPGANKTVSTTPQAGRVAATRASAAAPQPSLHPTSSASAHPATVAPVSSPAAAPTNGDNRNNGAAVQTLSKANPASSEKSATPLTLVIRAKETSWISVLADGQAVSQETLIAPANTSVRANREIVAKVGNAAGVTFLFNGQEIPADGAEAEVKTFVFDSNGMRVAAATPTPAQ
jgi:cytoskeletal protein RodZ